jgi:hypothetical protein
MNGKPEQLPVVSGRRSLTGVRRTADTGYAYLSVLFFAAVLVKVFLAGTGVFGIDALEVDEASSFDAHRTWGLVLAGLAGVLLVLALAARESRPTMIGALALFLLVMFAQSVLASIGESSAWVGGLHALDGMVILLISAWIALLASRRRRSR